MNDYTSGDFVSIKKFRELEEQVRLLTQNQVPTRPQPPAPPPPRTPGYVTSAADPPLARTSTPRSATLPAYNNDGTPPVRPSTNPPALQKRTSNAGGCKHAGCSGKACDHTYEEIVPDVVKSLKIQTNSERTDHHTYEKFGGAETSPTDPELNTRLKVLERKQREIVKALESLRTVIVQSNTKFKESLTNIQFKVRENSDHLGQQILHLSRDAMASKIRTQSSLKASKPEKSYVHTFDWEVPNVDSLAKTQQITSSQSYQINQLNFKVIGTVTCTRDGMMHIGMFGDFTHRSNVEKNCKFDLTVKAMDLNGSQPDMMLGKLSGDFNKGKEWKICDVSLNDLRQKGYIRDRPHVQLKYDIEITA